jgi:hypothetical protein
MSMDTLKGDYSPMERVIFNTLRKQKIATTNSLLRKVYPHKNQEPFNATIIINRAVITLGLKLERYDETYRLNRQRTPKRRLIENRLEKISA